MARSTYYYHTKRLSEPDGYDDARAAIRKIYDHHKGRYDSRSVLYDGHISYGLQELQSVRYMTIIKDATAIVE